jgi:transposase-like protein
MKASKFSDAQKAFILKQGDDGVPVAEICRKAGISQATYFNGGVTGVQKLDADKGSTFQAD